MKSSSSAVAEEIRANLLVLRSGWECTMWASRQTGKRLRNIRHHVYLFRLHARLKPCSGQMTCFQESKYIETTHQKGFLYYRIVLHFYGRFLWSLLSQSTLDHVYRNYTLCSNQSMHYGLISYTVPTIQIRRPTATPKVVGGKVIGGGDGTWGSTVSPAKVFLIQSAASINSPTVPRLTYSFTNCWLVSG